MSHKVKITLGDQVVNDLMEIYPRLYNQFDQCRNRTVEVDIRDELFTMRASNVAWAEEALRQYFRHDTFP